MVSKVPAEVVLARLAPEERRWVVEFADQIKELLGSRLRDLRLFGSKVRGDFHEESDIDVLVLIDGADWPTRRAIIDAATYVSPRLGPVVVDFERYHSPPSRATGFYEELRRESVRL